MTAIAAPLKARNANGADQLSQTIWQAIRRNSFCTLATSSAKNRPHVAGVVYDEVDGKLYVNILGDSVKARNINQNSDVAVCIPVRRIPLGPPATIHFQARASIYAPSDPHIRELLAAGHLKLITSHGELDLPGSCFVALTPARRAHSHGLGMSLFELARDPLGAGRSVAL